MTRDTFLTESKRLWSLSVPVVITQLGMMALSVVDTIMVGHVGVESLAAAALGSVWALSCLFAAFGIVLGMDPIVSQAHGAGDTRRMALGLQRGIVTGLLVSIPVVALFLFCRQGLEFLGQDPALAAMAHKYVLAQIPGIPAFLTYTALRQYLQGRGIMAPAMWVAITANIFNALWNWILIFGHFGFPAMGLTGAGVATSLTRYFMMVLLIWIIWKFALHKNAWIPWSKDALHGIWEIVHMGIPVGIHISLELWAFQIATLLSGRLGAMELAAHAIVLQFASIAFMVPLGISQGTVTRVGNLIGAKKFRQAQSASGVALFMGAGTMLVSAVILILGQAVLPKLYTDDVAVISLAASVLPIVAAFSLFDGVQVVGSGILRGMGRTRPAAIFNLIGYYGLALPLAWYLGLERGWGVSGVWWGLSLGLFTVSLLFVFWVSKNGPRTMENPEA